MMELIPKKVFLTAGVGRHPTKLGSFERALREAQIHPYNLVPVSSIIPPNAEIINKEEGLKSLKPGQIIFVVLSRISSDEVGRQIVASIGLAKLKNNNTAHGYISEFSAFDMPVDIAKKNAEYLAAEMLATSIGDPPLDFNDEKVNLDKFIIKSTAASATIENGDGWVTAIAAAVLLI
ncbi:MAG: arginine decarboxylase, pyruvoyl-dependent [Candidatus Odinarchaeota archaeon]|nr:arginine decarboxylase, pyruvoyl-dependent [Candidatus Odinarchaeota archaeon]